MNYMAAVVAGIVEEMRRDETVFAMGQDIRSGAYGMGPTHLTNSASASGTFPFPRRRMSEPRSGRHLLGCAPVLDMTISTFLYSAMDQVVNQAAKSRYMFGGQSSVPIVIRGTMFYGGSMAAHHADRPYPMFMNVPGLKIVVPSTPADAKGLIKSAIRDPDPVLYFEDSNLWGSRGEVPDDHDWVVPLGLAEVKRGGQMSRSWPSPTRCGRPWQRQRNSRTKTSLSK
jgi:pyruvate dehydrogenase E1 component beta subunit